MQGRWRWVGSWVNYSQDAGMTTPTPEIIRAAASRIAADVRRTPLWRLPGAALGLRCAEVWLKLEQLQVGGSFKARGMFNRMRSLPVPAAGVVVASGGNAGIAVATAAQSLGVTCEVFLPEVSSPAKRTALAALGARVVVRGAAYPDALAACLVRQRENGALLMHAYDQAEVVAGAGTLGGEIEAEAGLPERVLVSVGGGAAAGGAVDRARAALGARARGRHRLRRQPRPGVAGLSYFRPRNSRTGRTVRAASSSCGTWRSARFPAPVRHPPPRATLTE